MPNSFLSRILCLSTCFIMLIHIRLAPNVSVSSVAENITQCK
ncbi:hypothetical protein EDWATA_03111 [Edwardsiella tarda ATCC 23685]|uniref:Uncharacterized protein n=1 Tax=Edwardsiella tarda ATCC 23685 TaxID=500638 RepID=D4F8L0_EDWTA|nr:hypothetical protein EDWATA_03111 [Edwardsiella tarda ATCC 23685]